ncbi:MAG TPA: transposase [Methylophilus sp.]|nr:transposase [Methylophilus sp.]HQQ32519.1 transposase [Methylophilus sp.]
MLRRPRVILPNVPQHIIQRGNNRQACFYADEDYLSYLEWLKEYAEKTDCKIHAYVLMTNHVHLLVSTEKAEAVGAMMKALGQRYVQYINKMYKRTGTLWEGRYKSCPTQAETYLLACQRYIELNPVCANMVSHPAEYRWSSYAVNAQGAKPEREDGEIVTPHPLYQALGADDASRQAAYRELFRAQLDIGVVDEIRKATNGNYALGNALFVQQIEEALGRRVTAGKAGRPKLLNTA